MNWHRQRQSEGCNDNNPCRACQFCVAPAALTRCIATSQRRDIGKDSSTCSQAAPFQSPELRSQIVASRSRQWHKKRLNSRLWRTLRIICVSRQRATPPRPLITTARRKSSDKTLSNAQSSPAASRRTVDVSFHTLSPQVRGRRSGAATVSMDRLERWPHLSASNRARA